jgi:hypothetical protein
MKAPVEDMKEEEEEEEEEEDDSVITDLTHQVQSMAIRQKNHGIKVVTNLKEVDFVQEII